MPIIPRILMTCAKSPFSDHDACFTPEGGIAPKNMPVPPSYGHRPPVGEEDKHIRRLYDGERGSSGTIVDDRDEAL